VGRAAEKEEVGLALLALGALALAFGLALALVLPLRAGVLIAAPATFRPYRTLRDIDIVAVLELVAVVGRKVVQWFVFGGYCCSKIQEVDVFCCLFASHGVVFTANHFDLFGL